MKTIRGRTARKMRSCVAWHGMPGPRVAQPLVLAGVANTELSSETRRRMAVGNRYRS